MAGIKVIIMGLDPRRVAAGDAAYAAVPGMTGEAIMQVLASNRARLHALGFETEVCAVNAGPSVEEVVRDCFARFPFDCVVVGGGLRLVPGNTHLLEQLVNAVRRVAPGAAFCFNTGPADTVEAVLRVAATEMASGADKGADGGPAPS